MADIEHTVSELVYDVAILGGHLAAGVLAATLARNGVETVLVDAGDPDVPAGETTVPYTTAVVQLIAERYNVPEIGALAHFPDLPERVRRASGIKKSLGFLHHRPGRPHDPKHTVQFHVPGEHNEWHLYRPAVDEYARDLAVRNGAHTLPGRPAAVEVALGPDGVTVTTADGRQVRARYLVDAAGERSPLLARVGVVTEAKRLPRSRVLTTHMTGVKPFEDCVNLADYKSATAFSAGTVHHLFAGGWIQLVHFGNHPEGASAPLCGVTLSLDSDRSDDLPADPEAAFRALVSRYPSIAAQFANAVAAGPWTTADPWPWTLSVTHGERWFALERSAGRSEEFLSRDVTVAFEVVHALAGALLRIVREDAYAPAQFERIARFQESLNDFNDRMLAAARTASGDFRLWNAYSRVWLLWQILAHLSLKRARLDCAGAPGIGPDGTWDAVERFEAGGLWFRTPDGLGRLLDWFFDQFDRVRAGTAGPGAAADAIFRELGRARFVPPLYRFAAPSARYYHFTGPRRLLMLLWVKTIAPADFKRLLTLENVTGRREDAPAAAAA